MNEDKVVSQVSLPGRLAWAARHLTRLRGAGEAEAIRWAFDRWIDGEGREYLKSFGIDLAEYPPADVVPLDSVAKRREAGDRRP